MFKKKYKPGYEFTLSYEKFEEHPVLGKLYEFKGYKARLVCRGEKELKFIVE